jgi:protein TonB
MSKDLIIAILVSALLHAGFLFAETLLPEKTKVVKAVVEEEEIIQFEMPPLDPEPEETVEEMSEEQPTSQLAPPSLVDMPTVVPVNAFVQPMQPPPPPGLEVAKGAVSIPVNRPGTNFGKGMKDLFNLKDLDQQPVPISQPLPIYPYDMKREQIEGDVYVAFILSSTGDVIDAYAVRSTRREFERPAIDAVMKWKFRPGKKGGRAVSTKMAIPIDFTLPNS